MLDKLNEYANYTLGVAAVIIIFCMLLLLVTGGCTTVKRVLDREHIVQLAHKLGKEGLEANKIYCETKDSVLKDAAIRIMKDRTAGLWPDEGLCHIEELLGIYEPSELK